MADARGTFELGPTAGRLLVKTGRAGIGATVGHDLTLEPQRWRGQAVVDPGNPDASKVTLEVDVDSLRVTAASGGILPLTAADRREIHRTLRRKILHTDRFPVITFGSTRVAGSAAAFDVEGDLTIAGHTAPITVHAALSGLRVTGNAVVVQTAWGIRPYSALFGALKLADEVSVEFDLALEAGAM